MWKPLVILALVLPLTSFGQNRERIETISVSIFRDGNSFFIKRGNVPINNGKYLLRDDAIPKARFGTLWFSSDRSPFSEIISYTDTLIAISDKPAKDIFELLSFNQGEKAILTLEDRKITGEIINLEFVDNRPTLLHVLTSEKKWLSINPKKLQMVDFSREPRRYKKDSLKQPRHTVEIGFKGSNSQTQLQLMYLQKGMSWQPFYYLEIQGNKKAKITLRSEVVNDAEDLQGVELNFVVGIPNFRYTGRLSSLVKFQKLINPDQEFEDSPRIRRKRSTEYAGALYANLPASESPEQFSNQLIPKGVEDYYFYTLRNIDFPKSARAHFELFSTIVDYEDTYECVLTSPVDYDNWRGSGHNPDRTNKVHHSIKIKNNSKKPFAKAPVFIVKDEAQEAKPLAQSLLPFTPAGGNGLVVIAESSEIDISNNEFVVEKAKDGTNFLGRRYYKSTVKGVVQIKSYKNRPIKLEIRAEILGKLISTELPWEILWQRTNQHSPNDTNSIKWSVDIEREGKKKIEYKFEVYVRQ